LLAARKPPAKEKPGEFAGDVAIAGLGEKSIMDEDPTVKQLLADQMKPVQDPDAIPPASGTVGQPVPAAKAAPDTTLQGNAVPDFRGMSMRDVVQEASAQGIDVMVEGSGVARAQLPLPGSPLRHGEPIRVVFTR
jgi:hypothetical protein